MAGWCICFKFTSKTKFIVQNLASLLKQGQVGIMMGDFNVCCEEAQSTSRHSIMKRSETQSWEQLQMDVLHCDV